MENLPVYRQRILSLTLIGLITLMGTSGLFWRNSLLDTAIYASDEYAYLLQGKFYNDRATLFREDPDLQQTSNTLYLPVVRIASAITSDGVTTLKVVNVFLYTVVGLLLAGIIYYATVPMAACCFLTLYFLLPWSGYTASIQPETIACFGIVIAGLSAMAAVRFRSLCLCSAAGFIAAGSHYIKPNIFGVAAGTAVFLVFFFAEDLAPKRRALLGSVALGYFVVGIYLGLLIWRFLADQHWSWIPEILGRFYVQELQGPSRGALKTAALCCIYFGGHIAVLLLIFPAGIAGLIQTFCKTEPSAPIISPAWMRLTLSRWFAWAGTGAVLAVSYYTVTLSSGQEGEAYRLHGRYFGFVFPFLLLFSFFAFYSRETENDGRRKDERSWFTIASILLFLGLGLWETFAERYFKIYPWDYPELTALFSRANNYWHEPALISTRVAVLLVATITALVLLTRQRFAKYFVVAYLTFCLICANLNNTAFQFANSHSSGQLTREARTLKAFGGLDHRPGAVVGEERYGQLSYVLFGLASKAKVLVKKESSEILSQDLPPGCEWVLCDGDYVPQFKYQSLLQTGKLRLFMLGFGDGAPMNRDFQMLSTQSIHIDASHRKNAVFYGFNDPEAWGSWSSAPESIIQLPMEVRGALQLHLRAWAFPGNEGKPLRVTIGDERRSVVLNVEPTEYTLEFGSAQTTNRIRFEFPVIRVHQWDRSTGFALAEFNLTRAISRTTSSP